jgi:hypothetical protein
MAAVLRFLSSRRGVFKRSQLPYTAEGEPLDRNATTDGSDVASFAVEVGRLGRLPGEGPMDFWLPLTIIRRSRL